MITLELEQKEVNLITIAVMQYFETMLEEQNRTSMEVNRLTNMDCPQILQPKINFYMQDLEMKKQILDDINTLWGKLSGLMQELGEQDGDTSETA